MTSMLLDEEFVAVFPSLVKRLGGMNEAAVLQTIHFAAQMQSHVLDGRRWVALTAAQIGRRTGLSDDAVLRALKSLREMDVLIAQNAGRGTRKLMWAIKSETLESEHRDSAVTPTANPRRANRESAVSTTTKNLEDKPNNISVIAEGSASQVVRAFVDKFRALYRSDPDGASIGRLARDAKRMLAEGRPLDVVIAAAEHCALKGHANLPSSLTALLAAKGAKAEPRGFRGIREFLESDDQD